MDSSKSNSSKKANDVVPNKLSQILNNYTKNFCQFFENKFSKFENQESTISILSCNSKKDKKELTLIIEKILHIFKISLTSTFIKNSICDDHNLRDNLSEVIQIVQRVIHNEERFEKSQKGPLYL